MRITEPYYQVRSNALIIYAQPLTESVRRFDLLQSGQKAYSGRLTSHTKKRMLSALDLLVQRSPLRKIYNPISETTHDFKMNFITLTIANGKNLQVKEAYDMLLNPWLRYMKNKQGLKDYVWKAEYQGRGQVHYHIGTNTFIPWNVVRWKWNQVQRRSRLLDDFATRYGHFDPNGTDIHSMENVQDCLTYIAKEMCKDLQNQKVTKGKIWDCNKELKRKRFTAHVTDQMFNLIDDAVQHGFAERIEHEHCDIIKTDDPLMFLSKSERFDYDLHIH